MVAVSLLLIAVGCLAVGLRGHQDPMVGPAVPHRGTPSTGDNARTPFGASDTARTPSRAGDTTRTRSKAGNTAPARPPAVVSPVVARSAPVALRIPAIDVDVSVSALGLNPDRTVQVPTNFGEPGWFRLGPSPGQVGSAVILGHVDSHEGPAVFYLLRFLRAGDRIAVRLADGVVAHFVVSKVATYLNEQFPARRVYASHGYSALQLVTCGGEFDVPTDRYLSNVVVYTSLVEVSPQQPH